jgi:enamine deaminase RidA (YjgF/YER057c/UK114 family)
MSPEDRLRGLGIGDDHGLSARSAIGVPELPGGMAVEVGAIVALA